MGVNPLIALGYVGPFLGRTHRVISDIGSQIKKLKGDDVSYLEPSVAQSATFATSLDLRTPLTMLNLLRYRPTADYGTDSESDVLSGRDAYQRYLEEIRPIIAGVGGKLLFRGVFQQMLIGPEAEQWDDALLVEYPSQQAFINMISSPEYQAISHHRKAALLDSRLMAMTAETT